MTMSVDFEARLDSALNDITKGRSSEQVMRDLPEASDLLVAAARLRALDFAPPPNLAAGKARVMQRAAQMGSPRVNRSILRPRLRLALAVGAFAVFAVLVGNLLFVQLPSSAARNPTFTATPTRVSLAPHISGPSTAVLPQFASSNSPAPAPVPVPDHVAVPTRNLISSSQFISGLCQCRS